MGTILFGLVFSVANSQVKNNKNLPGIELGSGSGEGKLEGEVEGEVEGEDEDEGKGDYMPPSPRR